MAFDIIQSSREFFEAGYEVLFHCSPYRGADEKWACFLSEEKREYFNGNTTVLGFGRSAEEAYEDYKYKKNEQSRNSTK
jgi:hypothetical protein